MRKRELSEKIAIRADIPMEKAELVLDVFIRIVKSAVASGDVVTLVGFGTFKQGFRSARSGRNPYNGMDIQISSTKTIKFIPAKAFKTAIGDAP